MALFSTAPGSPLMRWVPTLAVIVATAAGAFNIAYGIGKGADGFARTSMLLLSVVLVSALSGLQALSQARSSTRGGYDEREMALRLRAAAIGLAPIALLGILTFWYMSTASTVGWRIPARDDWDQLLFLGLCWIFGLPLIAYNWQAPAPLPEEDDQ